MLGPDLPDLEERLRRLPAALTVEPAAGLLERVARRGRRRRRLRRAAAAGVIVALLAGALATRAAVLNRTPGIVLQPGAAQEMSATRLAHGHARPVPANPVVGRAGTATAWAGRELIVWGGMTVDRGAANGGNLRLHADGAAYDLDSGRWRALPPGPEAQVLLGDGDAIWTGRELLIWGGTTPADPAGDNRMQRHGDGLAYDPARRAWRRLPTPPIPLNQLQAHAEWTGRELLVVNSGTDKAVAGGGIRGVAYDPLANRWRLLAPSPRLSAGYLMGRRVLWAGTRLLVWSYWSRSVAHRGRLDVEPEGADVWAYDPASDRWTVLPPPSARMRPLLVRAVLAWTGKEVLAVQGSEAIWPDLPRFAGRYDPDHDRWTALRPPPQRAFTQQALAWTGAALVLSGTQAYDPAGNRWLHLPAPSWHWVGQGRLVGYPRSGVMATLEPATR
jgi:hypothetical protein